MAAQPVADETEIRQRIGLLAQSIRSTDLEAVMASYAPDIVSFDVQPPFRQVGGWLIEHDHASVPLDFASGRGLLNLEP